MLEFCTNPELGKLQLPSINLTLRIAAINYVADYLIHDGLVYRLDRRGWYKFDYPTRAIALYSGLYMMFVLCENGKQYSTDDPDEINCPIDINHYITSSLNEDGLSHAFQLFPKDNINEIPWV